MKFFGRAPFRTGDHVNLSNFGAITNTVIISDFEFTRYSQIVEFYEYGIVYAYIDLYLLYKG